jgi:hypothetical protein
LREEFPTSDARPPFPAPGIGRVNRVVCGSRERVLELSAPSNRFHGWKSRRDLDLIGRKLLNMSGGRKPAAKPTVLFEIETTLATVLFGHCSSSEFCLDGKFNETHLNFMIRIQKFVFTNVCLFAILVNTVFCNP